MINKTINVICIFLLLLANIHRSLPAQQDGDPVAIGTYKTIHSRIIDEDRTLLIHLPRGYENAKISYPVVYMLYGDHVTTYYAEVVSVMDRLGSASRIPAMILVGIMNNDRYRDLLPEANGNPTGIGKFIRFFSEELFPFIEKAYRTKPYRILIGPQAGANFALYTMMTHPDMFNAFIINSPFRWRGGRDVMMSLAESFFQEHRELRRFMYITYELTDDLEREGFPFQEQFVDMAKEFQVKGLRIELNFIPENDEFLTPLGIRSGLKELFLNYPFPEDKKVESLDDILTFYQELSTEYGYDVDAPDHVLTLQSDDLSQKGKRKEMLRILHYMLDKNPSSGNALWRLGNYNEGIGELEKAVDYYGEMIKHIGSDAGMIKDRHGHLLKMVQSSAAHQVWLAIKNSDVKKGITRFRSLYGQPSSKYYFDEKEFNSLGYRLLGFNRTQDAVEIFKLNVEMYPESANVYDSLAEGYLRNGQKDLAVMNYQKSLNLNPENTNAEKMLAELKKK